jgi:Glycosyltransferase family 87
VRSRGVQWSALFHRWSGPISVGLTLLGVILGLYWIAILGPDGGVDGHAYFVADPFAPYVHGSQLMGPDAYLYSPAFAQVISPLRWLGWPAFIVCLRFLELGALAYLAGPLTPLVLFWSPVATEIDAANIHLLIGAAAIYGLRQPRAWAFVLLTKVTPGVGLLWFAARREWSALRTALALTVAISAISFALSPGAWLDWFGALAYNAGHPVQFTSLMPISIAPVVRVPLAAAVVIVAARLGWTWVLPGAITLALPATWFHALAILAAVPRRLLADWRIRPAAAGAGAATSASSVGAAAGVQSQ